eukprot:6462544-Amphidinium_carterae.1
MILSVSVCLCSVEQCKTCASEFDTNSEKPFVPSAGLYHCGASLRQCGMQTVLGVIANDELCAPKQLFHQI